MDAQNTAVILVAPRGPINVGLAARACANLGVSDLRLVTPVCDPQEDLAQRFSNHAQELLAREPFASLEEAIADRDLVLGTTARLHREAHATHHPRRARELAAEHGASRVAIVFGNEVDGLSPAHLALCGHWIHLPTPGPYPSYNLSHAVAVTLFRIFGEEEDVTRPPVRDDGGPIDQAELGALYAQWLAALDRSGFFRRTDAERYGPKLLSLIQRMNLGKRDARTLAGMLAHLGN